ncbi:HAD-IIIA family hydrolase [Klenkia brasiliensis]|uniref:D,D-heptose 1,7-bisphosphate phosphatase n=1 Tax=Klenkia brasiliensis TaxID=333142 RepID=A0A1G7SZP5_9ACTN|nr:HAD-IIIA family hydrolase [Klenkia brasiliensis]SDG27790.1 haloacid dehalogenase superfamily, subfamily IA, variant 3 with third motif having DD or ED [Klenkia brasiliensis]
MGDPDYAVVVPTLGRTSLRVLLDALAAADGPRPTWLVVVDDRREPGETPVVDVRDLPPDVARHVLVLHGGGRGPAAARNTGWRAVPPGTAWVAFLDDDVVVGPHWCADLAADLAEADRHGLAGTQAEIDVPLPAGRRPTDWERGTAGLATAWWITADMAYRRDVLAAVDGFDERFPRAFREDADLALRVQATGRRLVVGRRRTTHPVRPTGRWTSLRQQRGNADDVLMARFHGRLWGDRAHAPAGRRPRHLVLTAAGLAALTLRSPAAAALWAAGTAEFAWARIGPGPRDRAEVTTMLLTSAAIPPAATWWWLRALTRPTPPRPVHEAPRTRALLLDRDGTLVVDVPYNGDPARVRPVDGAVEAVRAARAAGLPVGVVTNQSGLARGAFTARDLAAVHDRVEELLGPFDAWAVCLHGPDDGCACRKPAPGSVLAAAATLGVEPADCVLVGDIGSDVAAAHAAGARAVLVPTAGTRTAELAAAPAVARDLGTAVALVVGQR